MAKLLSVFVYTLFLIHVMLRIKSWNVRGIMYGTPYLSELLNNTDVFIVVEHWLLPEQISFVESIHPNFYSYGICDKRIPIEPENRTRSIGFGGVAIMWRKEIPVFPVERESTDRVLLAVVKCKNVDIHIIGVLLPSTNQTVDEFKSTLEHIERLYDSYSQNGPVIILGDFNAHLSHGYGGKNTVKSNERGKLIEQFLDERRLQSVSSQNNTAGPDYTYVALGGEQTSLIDHVVISEDKLDLVGESGIIKDHYLNCSDHLPIFVNISLEELINIKPTTINNAMGVNWRKVSTDDACTYRQLVRESLTSTALDGTTLKGIEEYITDVSYFLVHAADLSLPKKRYRPFLKPYWKNGNIKQLHAANRQKRNIWIREGRPRGMQYVSYKEYKQAKRDFTNALKQAQRQYEQEEFIRLQETAELDIGLFYRSLKQRNKKSWTPHELRVNDKIVRDPDIIRHAWYEYYKNLAQIKQDISFDAEFTSSICHEVSKMHSLSFEYCDQICETPISDKEVSVALRKMKNGKAPGFDGIVTEHIKIVEDIILDYLVKLFNAIIDVEHYPQQFKSGVTVTLFKGGNKDKLDMNSYRDITLMSVLQKLFENVLYARLQKYSRAISFPHPLQQGFTTGCGSITAAFVLSETVNHYMERDSDIYVAFLDNEKAFNSVWHTGLFYKLFCVGINGKSWRLLVDSFHNMTSCILYDGKLSDSYTMRQGVGQGRVLSSWFFLLMINGLILELDHLNNGPRICNLHVPCVILADDTSLISSTASALQTQLNVVVDYASKWHLKYNPSKSCIIYFTSKRNRRQSATENIFLLGNKNTPIDVKEENTYAGVTITNKLSSDSAISRACCKGRKMMNSLINVGVHKNGINPILGCKMWKTVVTPAVLYGCELWTNVAKKSVDNLEILQRFTARRIQGFDRQSPSNCTIYSLGLMKMEKTIQKRQLLFWNRLCRSDYSLFFKQLFIARLCTFSADTPQKKRGFVACIYKTMQLYKIENFFTDYILHRETPPKSNWTLYIDTLVLNYSQDEWRDSLRSRPEHHRYAQIHKRLEPHPLWLLSLQYPKYTWKLAELIIFSFTYETEVVICKFCKRNVCDLVQHFILDCPILYKSREHLMDSIVNSVTVNTYVKLTYESEDIMVSTILGKKDPEIIPDEEWQNFLLSTSEGIAGMIKHMRTLLYM